MTVRDEKDIGPIKYQETDFNWFLDIRNMDDQGKTDKINH